MNNSYTNKNIVSNNKSLINWKFIQEEMKSKLGSDVYESWLKKINFEKP